MSVFWWRKRDPASVEVSERRLRYAVLTLLEAPVPYPYRTVDRVVAEAKRDKEMLETFDKGASNDYT